MARQTSPPRAPADASGHRRIRRGDVGIDARIDLHGHTQDEARSALVAFVQQAAHERARCVLVITGKGRMGGGVLRTRFPHWLEGPEIRGLVAGFAPAHDRHGGDGAWYLLLKARPARKE